MTATVQSVSHVKAHLADVLKAVNDSRNPVIITQNGSSTAVIQDHASYQRTQEALLMLKLVAMGEADAAKGRTTPQREVFASLKQRLRRRIAQDGKSGKHS